MERPVEVICSSLQTTDEETEAQAGRGCAQGHTGGQDTTGSIHGLCNRL